MRRIEILLTSDLEGGIAPFQHGDLEIAFSRWAGLGEMPLIDGALWAFIDWAPPDISGLELCRRLRCNPLTASAHITMVLEKDDAEERRRALRAGADDHLIGPLSRRLLLDRIMSMQLHDELGLSRTIELGDLSIDLAVFQTRWQGRAIPLMPNEFRLLRYLAQHPGRVFTRSQLMTALGKQEPPIDERTVDVWIVRLRRAFRAAGAGDLVRTVRSLGYVLEIP